MEIIVELAMTLDYGEKNLERRRYNDLVTIISFCTFLMEIKKYILRLCSPMKYKSIIVTNWLNDGRFSLQLQFRQRQQPFNVTVLEI